MPRARAAAAPAAAAALALALTGCSSGATTPAPAPATAVARPVARADAVGWSDVATARGPRLRTYEAPGGEPGSTLDNPNRSGGPLVLLVTERRAGWLRVQLPLRPNGATAWIRAADADLSRTPYRLVVSRGAHRLEVWRAGERQAVHPVGVGTAVDPTPTGTYYLTDLIAPRDPDGVYGPYAFGLSMHSTTRTTFAGGPGQIGLHGTNEPERVGSDVSHGCLRVTNDVIRELARTLPLGTPIEIRA